MHARAVGELGDGEFDSAARRQARCLPLENVHHIPSSIAAVTRIRIRKVFPRSTVQGIYLPGETSRPLETGF